MPLKEILIRNFDSTNPDPVLDLSGCRKRGMVDAIFDSPHEWGSQEGLPKFVVIKCDLTDADLATYEGFRMPWRDNFDYEIMATNPAQGRYSIRIFELNVSPGGANSIIGAKAAFIEGYLTRWGCTSIVVGTNQVSFNIALWDAVRSVEFWDVDATTLSNISFVLNSYSSQTGIANITATYPLSFQLQVSRKIVERGGTIISSGSTSTQFTIERSILLQKFSDDIKRKAQKIYMYQRFRVNSTQMDLIVASGGFIELTKAQLVSALLDSMA